MATVKDKVVQFRIVAVVATLKTPIGIVDDYAIKPFLYNC